jgi:hypothetical protein
MLPQFLVPEVIARENGLGAEIALGNLSGKTLLLTLGINRILEQQSLRVSVWGSTDRERWKELAVFPQKFYCGTYSLPLGLDGHPEVRYVRAEWKMDRWGRSDESPLFGFHLYAEPAPRRVAVGAA